jgi:hypothetical protein
MVRYKCYKCEEIKDEVEFSNDKSRSTGRSSKCRKCKHEYSRLLRQKPPYRIIQNQKRRIRKLCNKHNFEKTLQFNDIFGVDVRGLVPYLENQFINGMTWDNYGEWEVDHISPLKDIEVFDDIIKLCHYTNLQPLWLNDHKIKTIEQR